MYCNNAIFANDNARVAHPFNLYAEAVKAEKEK